MKTLPANKSRGIRDALYMIQMTGMEAVTKSLRMGDAFDMDSIRPLANRCRALADAFDARMKEIEND